MNQYKLGNKVRILDQVFIIAMTTCYGSAYSYNLINVDTGDCWFANPKGKEELDSVLKELESDTSWEFALLDSDMRLSRTEMMLSKLVEHCCEYGYTGIVELKLDEYEAVVRKPNGEIDRLVFSSDCGWH